jgi:glycosyltransferase involved in cell wall biosynthesis
MPERRRRLCMVVHGPYPESRVARESAAALEIGYEVEIIATRRKGETPQEVIDGADVTRLPVGHVQGAGLVRMLGEYLAFTGLAVGVVGVRTIARRYDVVHIHTPPDFLIASALIPRLLGSRVILDIHDRSPDMFSMRFPGRLGVLARASLERLERLAARLADVVVTVHDPYARELVALGIPAEKTIVVMNSLDERLLPSPKPPLHEPFRIVYHGTLTPHYGVDLLVEATAQIVERGLDARVEIIGEGDSLPKLRARVAALGLSDRVAIDGRFLPHRSVLERINGASVGVVPNLPIPLNRFALSSKLFEYVVLGVPVVSAALPTLQEYFSDQEVRFFEPGNAESLADALLAVSQDPHAASLRAERARRRYASYRWEVNRQRYVGILDRLSSGNASVPLPVPRP